uniref:MIR domain-containing protein n=1 Tax=Hydatigena taeniaeformis TaxID=6205 RepID=A0A0R3WVL8_HYDTA
LEVNGNEAHSWTLAQSGAYHLCSANISNIHKQRHTDSPVTQKCSVTPICTAPEDG